MPLILFDSVSKLYPHGSVVLDKVNLAVGKGEFVSIVGPSGAGKTTLLRMLIADVIPTEGKVFVDDVDVHRLHNKELPFLRRKIGSVFQDYKLLPQKTAFENIAFVLEFEGKGLSEITKTTEEVLEIVGLQDKARHFPGELSGGEKQRLAFARALVNHPEILLADEPTGNLDPLNTWDVVRLLLKIHEGGTTVILTSHDKEIINTLNNRVVTLDNGKIVSDEKKGRYIL